mgnify:CR=1 FL=1
MLLPVNLLAAKGDATPGDPVPINQFVDIMRCFIEASAGYSGTVEFVVEIAEKSTGPWFTISGTMGVPPASTLSVDAPPSLTQAGGKVFVPWLRGKLTTAPTAGTVTVNAYMKPSADTRFI